MKTKIDLWDVTFNIILRLDSIERIYNRLLLNILQLISQKYGRNF